MQPATTTLDPLYPRVLVLEAGGKRLAIVTLDLGRSFGEASMGRLQEKVRKSSAISCLLVTASHTHSAPVIQDEYQGAPPAWEQNALGGIAAAIATAASHLQDACTGVGTGSVLIGHNRLHVNDNGTVSFFERNPTMIPTSPVDPTNTSPSCVLTRPMEIRSPFLSTTPVILSFCSFSEKEETGTNDDGQP